MPPEGQTPPSPFATDALEHLQRVLTSTDDLSPEQAIDVLVEGSFTQVDANIALEELLMKGYLYEVNNALRLTSS